MTKHSSTSHPGRTMTAREQMQLRCFPQKQRETILQTLRYALRVKSNADLPKLFQIPVAVALKPGSTEELAARYDVPAHPSDPRRMAFDSAMALYCRSSQYGHALLTCETLFGIDMDPAEPPAKADREKGRALIEGQASAAQPASPRNPGKGIKPVPAPKPDGQPPAKKTTGAHSGNDKQDRKQLRTFHTEQIGKMRARFCAALSVMEENLPAFLREPLAIPLKIGTDTDLVVRFDLPEDRSAPERRALNAALSRYCHSFQYQHAILGNKTRFSIDLEPDEMITDDHRHNAIQQLRHLSKLRMARKEREQRDGEEA